MSNRAKGDMTAGNPASLIFKFAIPMMLGNVVQQMYSMADAAIVGRYVGKEALAAIGATQSVLMLTICMIIGLTMGVCIVTAQFFGAGREEDVKHTAATAIYGSLVMWGIISFLGATISRPVLTALKTPPEIVDLACTYLRINTGVSIAPIGYNMTSNIMRSLGDSKSSLYALMCSSILNIILDIVFVTRFGWGLAGAAWATVFAQIVSCLMNFARIYFKHPILHLTKEYMRPPVSIIKRVIGIGVPMAVQNAVESVGMIGVQGVVNTCGTNTIAAFTAAGKIDQVALMPLSSIGMAVSTYVGQNYGKGDGQRIKQGVRAGIIQSIIIGLGLTALIFSGRSLWAQLFVSAAEVEVIAIAAEYLSIVSIFYGLNGIMNILLNTYRGMGKMTISTISSCMNPLVKMTAAFVLNMAFGRQAIWFAWPIGWAAATIVPAVNYYLGHGVDKALAGRSE